MANSNTAHSKKLRAATAAAFTREKLKSGAYQQISLQGKREDMAVILAAIEQAGGTRVQALKAICERYLQETNQSFSDK